MEFTKGFKLDFEKWFNDNIDIDIQDLSYFSKKIDFFEHSHKLMRYALYMKFLETKKFYIGRDSIDDDSYWLMIDNEGAFDTEEYNYLEYKGLTLDEAIREAGEIYSRI